MLSTFTKRWPSYTLSFHLTHGEMFTIMDDVSSLLHFSIKGRLLDHSKITRSDALEMMVTYLGAGPKEVQNEMDDTRGCHARFSFLQNLYIDHLVVAVDANGDDAHVLHRRVCALRHTSCIQLAHPYFWTKIHITSMWLPQILH